MNWRQHWHTTKCFYYRLSISPQSKHQVEMQRSSLPWPTHGWLPYKTSLRQRKALGLAKNRRKLNVGHLMILQYQEIRQQGAYCGLPRKICHLQEVPSVSISQLSIPRYTPRITRARGWSLQVSSLSENLPLKFTFPLYQLLQRYLEASLKTICRSPSVYKNKG